MRLKSIELNGFKTFATKTNFEFAEETTVIVGPNGSGKSNIADAVRWVLGEQSYKLLRGKRTLDMIFSGSDQRPRAGMASVTIVFDNSDGWLPIDFSEVTITRRAYRDGKNEYLINGQQVLLRDVYELLGQSGLAERTYTIIGQGLVDAALSLKAEERRMLFEEAAGIGLYRSRKAEAERRLEKTHRNLDRVEDILSELRPRLRSLQKQAVRAEQYHQVKADLRVMLQEWYGYHWARVQENLNTARELEAKHKAELEQARETQARFDRDLSENQAKVQSQRSRLNTWHRELAEHHNQKENISREKAVAEERIRSLEKRIQDLQTDQLRLEEQEQLTRARYEQSRLDLETAQANLEEYQHKVEGAREMLAEKRSRMSALEDEAAAAKEEHVLASNQQIRLRSQLNDRVEQIERKQARLNSADSLIESARSNYDQIHTQYLTLKKEFDQASEAVRKVEAELAEVQEDRVDGEKVRQDLYNELSQTKTQYSQWVAELNVLEQAEQKLTGYTEGAKLLLTKSRSGKLQGALGTLSNFLEVPEDLERPIAAALGDYLDAVILERGRDSEQALEILLDETTKGVLLPLNRLVTLERPKVDGHIPGLVGIAADLIKAPPKYRPVVELLLGRVFILRDKADLKRVLRDQLPGTKAVTLRGEVYQATGEIIAGNEGQSGVLSRSRQRKSWQGKIADASGQIEKLEESLSHVDQKLAEILQTEQELKENLSETKANLNSIDAEFRQITVDHNSAERQIEWEKSQRQSLVDEIAGDEKEILRLRGELERTQTDIHLFEERVAKLSGDLRGFSLDEEREQLAHWETQLAVARRALDDINQRLAEREKSSQEAGTRVEENKKLQEEYAEQIASLKEETSFLEDGEKTIQNEITELRSLIDETDAELSQDEAEQKELQSQEAQARRILNQAERSYAQADINLSRKREKLESIQERIREDIGLVELEYNKDISGPTPLPLEGYVQKLPVVKEISKDLGGTIREQRAQLRRLGAVNPEAQDEYQDVNQRHDFLTEQLSDLRNAEADLKEVIAELDVLMEREFRKTFEAVAVEFKDIFSQLFGGGKGQLILSDPDDLTGSGVDINVRLPGRRMQGLSLLSGGERSLIAAALIFSLLRISPTPFCVLDEVDAMLDESNVARFRKLIRELSSETQFIVITHNRNTVEVADVIYGIIMSEDSSSQVLSLKLDEVDEVIDS
ncbi:MAG: chromosome segregation protein SMC [Chloroflexota bacterium]|nr:MAG: chromosome segregation protein SMC [Chloroflexota bacterium]